MTDKDKNNFYSELGHHILLARKKANLSQNELSKKVNMSRASIVNIEKGRQHPPIHLLWEIAEILHTDVQNLIPDFAPISEEVELKNVFERVLSKTTKRTNINEESLDKISRFIKKS